MEEEEVVQIKEEEEFNEEEESKKESNALLKQVDQSIGATPREQYSSQSQSKIN